MISQNELYTFKEECCGCELCVLSCRHKVLSMKPDSNGFLYPTIDNSADCIDCKRCVNICPTKKSVRPAMIFKKGYGGYALHEDDVKKSASGGLSYILGRKHIENGGIVYGVAYDHDCLNARYVRAATLDEAERFRTSKYFQSRKEEIYDCVKKDLQGGLSVLFVGLPCEVSALYNFLVRDYDNLFTVSLMCHGTTSPRVHQEFCDSLENSFKSRLRKFSVRHKVNGWKPYYIKAEFENGKVYLEQFVKTDYEIAFKYLKRPSCNACKFKLQNKEFGFKADMIIGDYHGAKTTDPFYNVWGASRFYITSEKGELLIKSVIGNFHYSEISLNNIYTGSPVLNHPTRKLLFSSYYSRLFSQHSLHTASSNKIVRFAAHYLQPLSKKYRYYLQRILARIK